MKAKDRKYIVKDLGMLDGIGRVKKFAFKLPSYCKRLLTVHVFSPELIQSPSENLDVELSLIINNQNSPVGNVLFSLGYPTIDDQQLRAMFIYQQLKAGTELSCYIKQLAGENDFGVHLIIECSL